MKAPTTTTNALEFVRTYFQGRTYAGRDVFRGLYETAIAYAGGPNEHVGYVIGESVGPNPKWREHEILILCNDGMARWFEAVKCSPVL